MLRLLRLFARTVKKDQKLLANYERGHPHFFRYLAFDAVLSVVLAFLVFNFTFWHDVNADKLEDSGEVAMSSTQVIHHVAEDKVLAHWFGPLSGYAHTVDLDDPGIVEIVYLPLGADPVDESTHVYQILTYKDQQTWDRHTHPLLDPVNTKDISVGAGLSVKINLGSMKSALVTWEGKPEAVEIVFAQVQTEQSIIDKAKALTPVA